MSSLVSNYAEVTIRILMEESKNVISHRLEHRRMKFVISQ